MKEYKIPSWKLEMALKKGRKKDYKECVSVLKEVYSDAIDSSIFGTDFEKIEKQLESLN